MQSRLDQARARKFISFAAAAAWAAITHANALRVVTYNVDADTGGATGSMGGQDAGPGLETVLEGIGNVSLNDNGNLHAQPFDVLALEELAAPVNNVSPTLTFIVNNLNATYGAGTYAYDPTVDSTTGSGDTGNGPSGLIYDTKTVQVVSASVLGTASTSGAARAPLQYLLQPKAYGTAARFYLDVSHTKEGSSSSDVSRRNVEAQTLTGNIASGSHVVAVGDYNIYDGSGEAAYQTMISRFNDVGDPDESWNDGSQANANKYGGLFSETAKAVQYRDDIQFVTPTATMGSSAATAGVQYDTGSYTVFGNFGSPSLYNNAVNSSANTNSAGQMGTFNGLTAAQTTPILNALTTDTDHLPVVADYNVVGVASKSALLYSGFATSVSAGTTVTANTGNWDLATYNFTGNSYTDPSQVIFGDEDGNGVPVPSGNVTIQSAGVTPGSVTFTNNSVIYHFTTGGSVGIGGTGGVSITGGGTVIFSSTNSYSGGTIISASTLKAAPGSLLSTGTVTIGASGMFCVGDGITNPTTPQKLATGNETWTAGGTYLPKVDTADSGADLLTLGTNADPAGGTLTLTGTGAFNIAPTAVNGSLGQSSESWELAAFNSFLAGYSGALPNVVGGNVAVNSQFALNTAGLGEPGADFTLTIDELSAGHDALFLNYTATPEPGTGLLIFAAAGGLLMNRRRSASARTKDRVPNRR